MAKKVLVKNIAILVIVVIAIISIFAFWGGTEEKTEDVTISKLVAQINDGDVQKIEVSGEELNIELQDGTLEKARKEPESSFSETLAGFNVEPERLNEVDISIEDLSGSELFYNTILPFLIPFVVIAFFIWIMLRSVQSGNKRAMSFGQTKDKTMQPSKKKITFKDVAGVKEAKEEIKEIVDFLKNPQKFTALGAEIPRGALLVGPPGTGKTLLAEAIAGEANVPFFHISGSEFVEMFVGVGASRVRDLFDKAKKTAPSIVFIDEIDAVGRQRGTGLGGSHDEREQTLNQILVEMDGFDTSTHVIVVAATNRPDVLDPALLRPKRFDRRITLNLPDIKERMAILKVHSQKKPLAPKVDLKVVAQRTPGFSGADLSNVLNEAAILAARRGLKAIGMNEALESIEKVMLGPERKSRVLTPEEKKIIAYHEAGHALVAHKLPHTDPVHKVSIISRGPAGGYTMKMPGKDRYLESRTQFLEELAVLLAGYATEKNTFGDVTTGASSDLRRATRLARKLIMDYGMSKRLGPMTFGEKDELIFLGKEIGEQRNYSENIASEIDAEIREMMNNAYNQAQTTVQENKNTLDKIAKTLVEKETLERKEFEKIAGPTHKAEPLAADDKSEKRPNTPEK